MNPRIPRVAALAGLSLAILSDPAPASGSEPIRRYALLVGANDGGPDRITLRYAETDAKSMGQVLSDLGGVRAEDRVTLLEPTVAEIERGLAELRGRLEAEDDARSEVVFYYSGHSDEEGLLLGGQRYDYPALRAAMDAMPADVRVAILDSCASGALVRGKGGTRVSPFLVDASSQVTGYAYITSSAADETAQEAETVEGSYFTHFLTSGLRGAADVTRDGRVTLNEAYQFAFDETLSRTERSQHGPQHPSYDFQLVGSGDLVLTDLQATSAALVLDPEIDARTWVRDDHGHLVAELSKPAGRAITLGVAPGRYRVTLYRDGAYGEALVTLSDGETLDVSAAAFEWSPGEIAIARGTAPGDVRHSWFSFRLAPRLRPSQQVVDRFALNAGVGRSTWVRGAAVGLGANLVDRDGRGFFGTVGANVAGGDLSGFVGSAGVNAAGGDLGGFVGTAGANVAGGNLSGFVGSAGVNVAGGDLSGFAGSAGANVAGGDLAGLVGTGGVNVAGGRIVGLAVGGVGNWSGGDTVGLDVGSAFNVTEGTLRGAQVTGGVNVGGAVHGVQVGSVNVADTVRGLQFGVVNVGGTVRGVQVGVVNVAEKMEGVPIGLVSVVKDGRHDVLVYTTETDPFNLDLKLGSRQFFTVFGVGGDPWVRQYASVGFGMHLPGERLWGDVDAQWAAYLCQFRSAPEGPRHLIRARATAGWQIGREFAPFVGASMTWRPPLEGIVEVGPGWGREPERAPLIYPGIFAGVQI